MAKKDYVVLGARLGSSEGGMACGPVGGAEVGEIEFIEEHDYRTVGHSQYMAFVLFEGILNPILSDKSLFDELIHNDSSDETIRCSNDLLFQILLLLLFRCQSNAPSCKEK